MQENMKQNIDSDSIPAMHANYAFNSIIDKIRNSNLNFQLQMSPFSAQISLKNSLVTERTGVARLPPSTTHHAVKSESDITAFAEKNMQLERELDNLKLKHAHTINDRDEAYTKIKYVEEELNRISIKQENSNDIIANNEALQIEISKLSTENIKFSELVKEQMEEINDLQKSVKIKTEISDHLNKKLSESKIKSEKDSVAMKKSFQVEIKSWKKELGKERKEKVKLEKKLEKYLSEHDTNKGDKKKADKEVIIKSANTELCSLLNSPVSENFGDTLDDYVTVPEYYEVCKHAVQCVIRQPYPPPSPSMPFIVHEVSKYHEHMMNKTQDDLTGCLKCFSVDNENYGCDKCTWLKWWFKWHGLRHGFPDIHPSVYKKYQ